MGRCGGRGRAHHKHARNSQHPFKFQSFHGSRRYSIYSFAQLSWHSTGENEHWMERSWVPSFLIPFSFSQFSFEKPAKMNFRWVHVEGGAEPTTNTRVILSTLWNVSLFMTLEDILSIVLRSCPGTAMGRMNFGYWKDLGSLHFSSRFPITAFFSNTC